MVYSAVAKYLTDLSANNVILYAYIVAPIIVEDDDNDDENGTGK